MLSYSPTGGVCFVIPLLEECASLFPYWRSVLRYFPAGGVCLVILAAPTEGMSSYPCWPLLKVCLVIFAGPYLRCVLSYSPPEGVCLAIQRGKLAIFFKQLPHV